MNKNWNPLNDNCKRKRKKSPRVVAYLDLNEGVWELQPTRFLSLYAQTN